MSIEHFDVIIAGAGLSGLATAHFLKKYCPDKSVLILEKDDRVGGAIRSLKEDGYLGEWGPHGFLDNVAETVELMTDLDFGDELQKASLKKFLRYVCMGGRLKQIPQTPPKILKSDLMSLPSKMRVLAELWKRPKQEEQSVAEWVRHRLGKAFLPFADIVLTGTYAGDIEKLSVDAVWPGFRNLELTYGSVFKGIIKQRKQKKSNSATSMKKSFPSMVSFTGGMEQLAFRLASDKNIRLSEGVERIVNGSDGWEINTSKGEYTAGDVVLALQINQSLSLLTPLKVPPQPFVNEAIINNVVLGFEASAEIPFGFGYLAPKTEKRFALGAMFPTHMFPGRAPGNKKTLEVLIGGTRNPERIDLSDKELIDQALADVQQLIPLPQSPEFVKVLRPSVGIPQLNMGHQRLQSYRDQLEIEFSGLNICGFGWEGIGTNDMIKMARRTVENIKRGTPDAKETPQPKKIYV